MAANKITRHFVSIENGRWGNRQVQYRHVGTGPLVVLFHQSPLSSQDMIATMDKWKKHFTCIAPDTPGYGLSDPFGVSHLEMSDIAQAAVEFFDALGIERTAVYGFHTGAMIATALALHYPHRVVAAVANGYVVLTDQEREDIVANYLPPFEPKWDGSHLTWLWSRMREQTIFFPWYKKTLADRLDFNVPSPEALQAGLVDFLRSGDAHRTGYRAAFTMRSDAALAKVTVPLLVTVSKFDALASSMPRIKHKAKCVTTEVSGTMDETIEFSRKYLVKHKLTTAPPPPPTAPLRGRMWNEFIAIPAGQLRVRRNDDASGRPVIVQHDAAGSSEVVNDLARGFIGHRPVIAIDLPGHGESDNTLLPGKVDVPAYAKAVLAALKALGVAEFDFVGTWGGGLVGLELAKLAPKRLQHLVLADMLYFSKELRAQLRAHYTPDIQPNWYGGHLLEAWHLMRDQGLFWPWYNRTREGVIRKTLFIEPAMIHRRVIELFKSKGMWRRAYQAHFAYPLQQQLREAKVPMLFVAPSWDPQLEVTQQASRDFPQAPFKLMPDDMSRWAAELLPFYDT